MYKRAQSPFVQPGYPAPQNFPLHARGRTYDDAETENEREREAERESSSSERGRQ